MVFLWYNMIVEMVIHNEKTQRVPPLRFMSQTERMWIFIEVTIAGMMGKGSIRHNNRTFHAANVDRERTAQNVIFCNENIQKVYHELFDEALTEYNENKTKTRDRIPNYYEHIRNGKQEKLYQEAIFQIGNLESCGCGTESGERAAVVLKKFAETFSERNPHLRVFNMVLHMDEATPHLHIDYVPVATEQTRGLSTRVSLKQALKQQGFVGKGKNRTEWNLWMENEKEALKSLATEQGFVVISLGETRTHMALPEYKAAMREVEAVNAELAQTKAEVAAEQSKKEMLQGEVKDLRKTAGRLKAAEKVSMDLMDIQPNQGFLGSVKGVTIEEIQNLKDLAVKGAADAHELEKVKAENVLLNKKVPSVHGQMVVQKQIGNLTQVNSRLVKENEYLKSCLKEERSFTDRLIDSVKRMLEFMEMSLPESLKPVLDGARKLLPNRKESERCGQEHNTRKHDLDL